MFSVLKKLVYTRYLRRELYERSPHCNTLLGLANFNGALTPVEAILCSEHSCVCKRSIVSAFEKLALVFASALSSSKYKRVQSVL